MKKVLSFILTLSVLFSCVSLSAYAGSYPTPTGDLYCDLYELYYELYDPIHDLGEIRPYTDNSFFRVYYACDDAECVLSDNDYNDYNAEECVEAYWELYDAFNNMYIQRDYAKNTYILAMHEQNYNNWYSKEDWDLFTTKRTELRNAFDTNDEKVISDAYYELINAFNLISSRYTEIGDVNRDGELNVNDVTLVQKYLVGEVQFTYAQKMIANSLYSSETYYYEIPTINTATNLQKYIVGFEDCKVRKDFLDINSFGDEFNYMICMRLRDERYWVYEAMKSEEYDF